MFKAFHRGDLTPSLMAVWSDINAVRSLNRSPWAVFDLWYLAKNVDRNDDIL